VTPVRVGLIGCGKVGQIHAAALRGIPEAELAAVCDVSAERVGAFAGRYGARGYTDVDAMLRESRVEAVVIGTPHGGGRACPGRKAAGRDPGRL